MRLLLANPNMTQGVTELIAAAARGIAAAGTEIVAATGGFGGQVIATRTEMAVAEHASVTMFLAQQAGGCDGAIIGASLDSGLRAAREMLTIPVVGITEAALHTACLLGGRFGVIVTSANSAVITREMIAGYGLEGRLAGVRWLQSSAQTLLADPASAAPGIVAAAMMLVEEDLAEAIVLIGAVMAGMPGRVQGSLPVPVIEGVSCAVPLVEGLVRLRLPKATAGSFARLPARRLGGVDAALQARFGA